MFRPDFEFGRCMNSLLFPHPARGLQRAGLLVSLLVGASLSVHAQPHTGVSLPAAARGAAAISALGTHLPAVAKAYGLEAQGLANLLRTQPSLGVDQAGTLLFVCDGPGVHASVSGSLKRSAASDAMTPNSAVSQIAFGTAVDAFQLHSFPGATRVIYLDFTGHTTSGTSWNSYYTGGSTIVSQPFDLDGDRSSFNSAERALIQSVWQRVAEDYAPFAIDVTTEDPGVEALRRTTSTDTAYGVRVVIGPNGWYNSGAGGVGYVGSFNWNSDTPCFAFSDALLNHEKYIGEAASHEAGHSLGLYHDGASGTEYYGGQGNWAPIMGVGYYKTLTQFSKGEYSGASNLQDDHAVITTFAPLASDDHGNTPSAASVLSGSNIADGGTIETRADVDVFRFDTAGGTISLNVVSPAPEPNLHIKAELLNSSGQLLQTNDISNLTASFTASLAAGTYYLRVSGIGAGDPNSTGYSDYGSLGNYVITGSVGYTLMKQAPVASASASVTSGTAALTVGFSGQGSRDADGSIASYRWDFGNGQSSTAMNPTYTYSNAGTFTAVLTVSDNDGLQGSASVVISVTSSANQSPVAVVSAYPTSGLAPLPVAFSSAGSFDPDGSITGYAWDFGDGTTSNEVSPNKTYTAAGNYTARLTVTDNRGATASSTVSVSVGAGSDRNNDIDVAHYALTAATNSKTSSTSGVATVVVRNRQNIPVAGVTVTVIWSGVVSNSTSGKTDANGQVTLTTRSIKRAGTVTGTITSVIPPSSGVHDAAIFAEPTSRTVAIP
jgi:PKD repeat protein